MPGRIKYALFQGLAVAGAATNVAVMGLSFILGDEWGFLVAWAGASFAGYAILAVKEEARDVAAASWGYKSLAMRLRWEINEESLHPGDRLPTPSKYAARFGTSRNTVRRALKLLEQEGLVVSVQGRGSYVVGREGYTGNRSDYPKDRVERDLLAIIDKASAGTAMPTAVELVSKHHVSATTVRRVQQTLAAQGLIRATRSGLYVKA